MKLRITLQIFAPGGIYPMSATQLPSSGRNAVPEGKPLTGVSVIDHHIPGDISTTSYKFQVKNRLLYNPVG